MDDLRKVIHFISSPDHAEEKAKLCRALATTIDAVANDRAYERKLLNTLMNAIEKENDEAIEGTVSAEIHEQTINAGAKRGSLKRAKSRSRMKRKESGNISSSQKVNDSAAHAEAASKLAENTPPKHPGVVALKNQIYPASLSPQGTTRTLDTSIILKSPEERSIEAQNSARVAKLTRSISKKHVPLSKRRKASVLHAVATMRKSRYIIPEDHPFRLSWDIYMLVLILYYAFMVPVRVGFDLDPKYPKVEHFFTVSFW